MKIGAVLFDGANNVVGSDRTIISVETGWASIAGGAARRIKFHQLPSDVVWYTNLPFNAWLKSNLAKHPNFRNSEWLRTPMLQLMDELGVDESSATPAMAAEAMAALAWRICKYGKDEFGIVPTDRRKLSQDYTSTLATPTSRLSPMLYPLFAAAAQHPVVNVIRNTSFRSGYAQHVILRANRIQHARRVLATPLPQDSGWESLDGIPPDGSDGFLDDIEHPFLVRCRVSDVKPVIAEMLSWGAGARNSRDWLTDIEWRVVRQYGRIEVQQVLVNPSGTFLPPQADLIPRGYLSELSITHNLVAEQLWTSLTNSQMVRQEARFTAAAAWLRSTDRMQMFDLAQKLNTRGVDVISYGVGNVVCRYPENGLKRVLDIATDIGLMPPAGKIAEARSGIAA